MEIFKIILERKELLFQSSKLFWSTKNCFFSPQNYFGAQKITFLVLKTILEHKELLF